MGEYNFLDDYDSWADYVYAMIDNEGFDYCFVNYSNFDNVEDEKFHKLRKKYLKVQKELNDYIEQNLSELDSI